MKRIEPQNANPKLISLQYCLLQAFYWAGYCGMYAFATVLLLAKDFSSQQIGFIVAIGNILGVLFQPVIGGLADRGKNGTLHKFMIEFALISAIAYGLMLFSGNVFLAVALCFIIADMAIQVVMALINSLSVYYVNKGLSVDFGLARGVGSAAYAATSSVLGTMVSNFGENILIYATVILLVVFAAMMLTFPLINSSVGYNDSKNTDSMNLKNSSDTQNVAPAAVPKTSTLAFFGKYKAFTVVLIGITCLYVFHNIINCYMIHYIEYLGGDSANMGIAIAIAAFIELPTMAVAKKLNEKFGSKNILMFSAFFFTVKAIVHLFVPSVTVFYFVQLMQALAFAIMTPTTVYFVNDVMNEEDKYKGQSIMMATSTLGGVIANIIGGTVVGSFGVYPMLLTCVGFSAVGTVLVLLFTKRVN